jgi:hypothetical protein
MTCELEFSRFFVLSTDRFIKGFQIVKLAANKFVCTSVNVYFKQAPVHKNAPINPRSDYICF